MWPTIRSALLALVLSTSAAAADDFTLLGVGDQPASAGGGGGGGLTFSVPASNTCTFSGTPTLPFTCSNMGIGTASSDRVVVVSFAWGAGCSGTNGDVSGVTIGGTSATKAVDGYVSSGGGCNYNSSLWYANITAGTTANVAFSAIAGNGWLIEGVVTTAVLKGNASASPVSTTSASPPAYPGSCAANTCTNSASETIAAGNVGVFAGAFTCTTASSSWSNATKDMETGDGVNVVGTVAHATATATVTETVSSCGAAAGWVGAVFH